MDVGRAEQGGCHSSWKREREGERRGHRGCWPGSEARARPPRWRSVPSALPAHNIFAADRPHRTATMVSRAPLAALVVLLAVSATAIRLVRLIGSRPPCSAAPAPPPASPIPRHRATRRAAPRATPPTPSRRPTRRPAAPPPPPHSRHSSPSFQSTAAAPGQRGRLLQRDPRLHPGPARGGPLPLPHRDGRRVLRLRPRRQARPRQRPGGGGADEREQGVQPRGVVRQGLLQPGREPPVSSAASLVDQSKQKKS
jgi:hypothetical protein